MTREISKKESTGAILDNGAFAALVDYVNKGDISPQDASVFLGAIFKYYLAKVREAQSEVRRIEMALQRVAHICESGMVPKPWQAADPRVLQLAHELTTLDGWVTSLNETNLTMIGIGNPQRGKEKPYELAKSMEALWAKRRSELHLGLHAPDLFKLA